MIIVSWLISGGNAIAKCWKIRVGKKLNLLSVSYIVWFKMHLIRWNSLQNSSSNFVSWNSLHYKTICLALSLQPLKKVRTLPTWPHSTWLSVVKRDMTRTQQVLHIHFALPERATTQPGRLLSSSPPFSFIQGRPVKHRVKARLLLTLWYKTCTWCTCVSYCVLSRRQSITWRAEHMHINSYTNWTHTHKHTHRRLEPGSLIRCCHGNPIKRGHSGNQPVSL